MKKILLETSFSKIYMIGMIIITLLVVGGYFSYAMFTVSKEKSNAISIVTGNLTYKLEVEGVEENKLTVPNGESKEFIITLSNPNNRIARFNFYYEGSLPDGVSAGYVTGEGINIPPGEAGINLEKSGSSGSSNTYTIRVSNTSGNSVTITLGVNVGLDYNDLALPSNGHLFLEYKVTLAEMLLVDNTNNINNTDPDQTFITGENPHNYIWYSGKLWRAVSIDPSDNSVKIITQNTISAIPYGNDVNFSNSYMKIWLNDTSVDGFLGNLRDPDKFIKMDSKWNATETTGTGKLSNTTIVESAVGLLNIYEYTMSYTGTTYQKGYLNCGHYFYLLNPNSTDNIWFVSDFGPTYYDIPTTARGIRPAVNLKADISVEYGDGTEDNPYRLEGDNDTNLAGTLLNTRYSGEYIRFGTDENNLYRIVSHEKEGLTKVTSVEPLKDNGTFKTLEFGDTEKYSKSNIIGSFLNGEYLNSGEYLNNNQIKMIEESNVWYLGYVDTNRNYLQAKYDNGDIDSITTNTTNATVGLLRLGEMFCDQIDISDNNTTYWILTPYNNINVWYIDVFSNAYTNKLNFESGIRPVVFLKENVIITSGDGTLNNPFEVELRS